jgi:peptidoglycan/LPS O-acetylase OafA/YrhL
MVFVRHAPLHLEGLDTAQQGMRAGVVIFFALSGYLLFRPFVVAFDPRVPGVDLRAYAVRRLARIFPAYLLATFVLSALSGRGLLNDPIGQVSMLDTPIAVVWSLRVELVFYALLPFFAIGLRRVSARRRAVALLAGGSASFGVLLAMTLAIVVGILGVVPAFLEWPGALWQFVPGMLVALLVVQRPDLKGRLAQRRILAAGVALILLGVALDLEQYDIVDTIGAGLLIAHLVSRPQPAARVALAFELAGGLSYAFYLWHYELLGLVGGLGAIGATLAGLGLALAVSAFSWFALERPMIAWAHRWTSRAGWAQPVGQRVVAGTAATATPPAAGIATALAKLPPA